MSPEKQVLLNIFIAFLVAAAILYFMAKNQRKKETEADGKYEFTMKLIEMRNKKHGDKNESKKTT